MLRAVLYSVSAACVISGLILLFVELVLHHKCRLYSCTVQVYIAVCTILRRNNNKRKHGKNILNFISECILLFKI